MEGVKGIVPPVGKAVQKMEESPFEARHRQMAGFDRIEAMLPTRKVDIHTPSNVLTYLPEAILSYLVMPIAGLFGVHNPLARHAKADENTVWVMDNTAYYTDTPRTGQGKWEAEFVSCYFRKGRHDIKLVVDGIVKAISDGPDAHIDPAAAALIASRVKPFVDAVAPARTLPVVVTLPNTSPVKRLLGPSNANGISVQTFSRHPGDVVDGEIAKVATDTSYSNLPQVQSTVRLTLPEGFGIISDIDDTIKITQTPDPIGILKTTFAEVAKTTAGLPEFYKKLGEMFQPTWFYLSASPYNLYPFLHEFIHQYYPPGTIILRDASWQTPAGLLGSLTQGVQAYKSSRIERIHKWLPERRFICVGDSTQRDPETYAAMYKKFPGWIIAIYIRKVTDAPFMEEKNKPERFEEAFEGVPANVWRLFENPAELSDHVQHIAGEAQRGV